MTAKRHILALDQGTTSSRAIVFDLTGQVVSQAQREFPQYYPKAGWVEHDAEEIWRNVLETAREALEMVPGGVRAISAIGIANQRETVVLWERKTGKPVYRAIVWQDRRTSDVCGRLKEAGVEDMVRARTGLLLDPYFSATKIAWLLDHVSGAREKAENGALAVGTIDSFLLWRLTGGTVHATDVTNASRTLLYDIHRQCWDEELLRLFRIPAALLPEVCDNAHAFGETDSAVLGRAVPVTGMAGDQQAALIGQACFAPGMIKATYGTGCFMLMNTGEKALSSSARLLTTPAYRLGGQMNYALEGAIFSAGAAVKWLRDGLRLIDEAAQTEGLAGSLSDHHGVYMVPAFVGLGAPWWDPEARGLICGLTLETTPAHLARAALESVAYQSHDLMTAMRRDGAAAPTALRIDGGMSVNNWFCAFVADILDLPVEVPRHHETTALGAAYLAGLAAGEWSGVQEISRCWTARKQYQPRMEPEMRQALLAGWRQAVVRTLSVTP
ncbi:glycerol kinase GlpK [Luteithermobacter gelatinilyticus]|uniref:glycerol kinase GlpK n=1 Tax=Luteithermobacter gelatinilyticus TaxID=2582913 RepID=UPI0011065D81|nr:glycerol kinase GlpK [Luteithermobacter gelatinilyticus]|tara:strand:+ start:15381 stop:16877 length:1497 start_codon:yes stop_codon:yes gene_type:complete